MQQSIKPDGFDCRSLRIETEYAIMLRRPVQLIGRNVPSPASQMNNFLCSGEAFLALAQRDFRFLALAHVDDQSVVSDGIILGIEIGNQDGVKLPFLPAGVCHGFFISDVLAGKRALDMSHHLGKILRTDDILNWHSQNRRQRHLKPFLKRAIYEPVAHFRIDLRDQCGNIVRDQPQALLALAQRLFGVR